MDKLFSVTASPHLHDNTNVKSVMWNVVIALMPALVAGVYFFGVKALLLTIYGVIAAVVTEAVILYLRKKPIVITDGSAVITGLLVSFNVHSGVPWWIPVLGSVFAIAVGKHAFGGLGHNIVNPALIGRAFLVASWPTYMTGNWVKTSMQSYNGMNANALSNVTEQITSATPLQVAKIVRDPAFAESYQGNVNDIFAHLTEFSTMAHHFWGNVAGVIGEVSVAALLIGAAYLLWKRVIEWRIPACYLGTVFVLTYIFGGLNGPFSANINVPIFHLLSGGLMLGALFMATDLVTSPMTKNGRIIFGVGCGLLTVVIRLVGGYPEGVSYSILIMNLFVPLIDKYTMPRPFGEVKK
jgi:electron transport complex protein RnfD